VILTGANRNDVTQLRPLLDVIPKVRGKRGRPRQRPDVVLADRGYDHDKYRHLVRELQIRPLIARRGTGHGSGLGKQRWVVEQVRREALIDRVEVRDRHLRPVAAG
jgi:transposase